MDLEVDEISPRRMEEIQARLVELEETLRAIHHGEVDAVVVSGPQGDRVFTLEGADHAYRVMVESLDEGAATLTTAGLILYANRRFAEMLGMPVEKLAGSRLHDIVQGLAGCALDELLHKAQATAQKQECDLLVAGGKLLPTHLSLTPLRGDPSGGICLLATDLTQQRQRQAELARTEASLRRLTARLLGLQDDERRRIARDLHDSTGQTLTVLGLKLGQLTREFAGPGARRVRKLLAESTALARQACTEIRDLAHLLHPLELEQIGIVAGIEWHLRHLSSVSGISVKLSVPPDFGRLRAEVEIALFRIVQESLENVRRHSGSPTATVRLSRQPERIVLEIQDQGRGMPSGSNGGQNAGGSGIGLVGMRERLRQLDGELQIESSEHGTLIRAIVPLPVES
ncbi:MAG: histidine kinase [Terriglobia bacterium]